MAKKMRKGEKTAAVQEYMIAHPEAMPLEIVAGLKPQGIKITASHVSNIKGKLKRAGTVKRQAKKPSVTAAATPAVVEKQSTNGGTITLDQVKMVAHTIKSLGGIDRVEEVLEVIKEMGGVKKFKELAEAMTVAETAADDFPH
jgi:hypothetical protein